MSCYHPLKAFKTPTGVVFSELKRYDIIGSIELPCGRCIGCRLRRAREWSTRCMHEAQLWEAKCFVTLTYSDENLPPGSSLEHRDFQLFMKRLRSWHRFPIRYFMCGEYGPLNGRPHFHALLYNVDFADRKPCGKSGSGELMFESAQLSKLWKYGLCTVQDLTVAASSYVARYVVDKLTGDMAEVMYACPEFIDDNGVVRTSITPEYCACSLKPGIGAVWFDRYGMDTYRLDSVVVDGIEYAPPKYYDKLARRAGFDLDRVEFDREKRAKLGFADNTDERRQVREVVHTARVRNLKRDGI